MAPKTTTQLLHALLDCTANDIVPLTRKGVESGCKVFGAAVLAKDTLEQVTVGTNTEAESPLLHGEITTIQQFYRLPKESRPNARDTIFFCTHEPCSLSGITWGGWDNFYYLFTYEETRDAFEIPHDLAILEAVFKVPSTCAAETREQLASRPLYNPINKFFQSASVAALLEALPEGQEKEELRQKVDHVKAEYNGLSLTYQRGKGGADIPLP
ncbi:SPOSA6832_04252, partial [Sporobolomyces salmonicolor]